MAKILIVDDSIVMRRNIAHVVTQGGHQVVGEAANGMQAIISYADLKPDLVTMDISMPKMSGVEAVGHIINKDPKAKIIMVSALNQKQLVFESLGKGAKHYIIKPITSEKLLEVIDEVLKNNEDAEEEEQVESVEPGFSIDNEGGKFIVRFNSNLGMKDHLSLDTAVRGLLFIKPLNIEFNFKALDSLSEEVLEPIIRLGSTIKKSGGNLEYKYKDGSRIEQLVCQFSNR